MKHILIEEEVKILPSDFTCTCGKNFIEFENYEKHWKTHFVKPTNKQKKKLPMNFGDPDDDYGNR